MMGVRYYQLYLYLAKNTEEQLMYNLQSIAL